MVPTLPSNYYFDSFALQEDIPPTIQLYPPLGLCFVGGNYVIYEKNGDDLRSVVVLFKFHCVNILYIEILQIALKCVFIHPHCLTTSFQVIFLKGFFWFQGILLNWFLKTLNFVELSHGFQLHTM